MSRATDLPSSLLDPLRHDLRATLGPAAPEAELERLAADMREFAASPAEYVGRVVEEAQQAVHDLFIDTAWPACPRHGRHPLWYRDGAWWCGRDGVAIARLGELGSRATR